MTIETLREYGANVDEGLARCMNMESFYLKLVNSVFAEDKYDELEAALAQKDLKKAFEIAHSLKGVYANLALTPLSVPMSEMTEKLRAGSDENCAELLKVSRAEFERLKALNQ